MQHWEAESCPHNSSTSWRDCGQRRRSADASVIILQTVCRLPMRKWGSDFALCASHFALSYTSVHQKGARKTSAFVCTSQSGELPRNLDTKTIRFGWIPLARFTMLAACFLLVSCFAYSSILKMEAVRFPETSVDLHWITWHLDAEDRNLHGKGLLASVLIYVSCERYTMGQSTQQ